MKRKKLSSSSSSNSSPERTIGGEFVAKYDVYLGRSVTKNGSVVLISVESIRTEDKRQFRVQRQYEDFEYLHHCLITAQKLDGLIVPPLPDRPPIEPELAQQKSRREMGTDSKTLIGDEFNKDCWFLQYYLRLMVKHPVFGANPAIDRFLTRDEAPARPKLRSGQGFLSLITNSFDNWKHSHKDCDEFFQKERDFVNEYSLYLKESSDSLNAIIYGRRKLCEVLSHLSATLNLNLCNDNNSDNHRKSIKFCNLFSRGLDDYRHCLDVVSHNDEVTLGNTMNYWHRYHESHKSMLFKRTTLQIDYETANRLLDKASKQTASKRQDAELAKREAEKAFDECSELARIEIKRFHRQRIEAIGRHMRSFAESQLCVAKDMLCVLHNSVQQLKQFDI
ncbi:sorting nexin-32-like isoform X2 [Oppia nitens]|uniref:sorting nexin-32-like isoform X2 n=1 Tax=Oppia nitens TaxID=1686743 RepID=UPI0023D9C46F|nr:sorting nexin-32-like isoform X2 [Oppia nitens]